MPRIAEHGTLDGFPNALLRNHPDSQCLTVIYQYASDRVGRRGAVAIHQEDTGIGKSADPGGILTITITVPTGLCVRKYEYCQYHWK